MEILRHPRFSDAKILTTPKIHKDSQKIISHRRGALYAEDSQTPKIHKDSQKIPRNPRFSEDFQTPPRFSDTQEHSRTPKIHKDSQKIPRHPGFLDTQDFQKIFRHPPIFRSTNPARAMWLQPGSCNQSFFFFRGYLTRRDDLVLLSITVIVDTISSRNARRCFRSFTDAYIRPGPDRR